MCRNFRVELRNWPPLLYWLTGAATAIADLNARLALRARVRRDNCWAAVPARELVPGAIIRIRLGGSVPIRFAEEAYRAMEAQAEAKNQTLLQWIRVTIHAEFSFWDYEIRAVA